MTDARIIHEDAVLERQQRQIRAGQSLCDEIRFAQRKYEREMAESERMYRIRIEGHPLTGLSLEAVAKEMFPVEYAAITDDHPMDPAKVEMAEAELARRQEILGHD